jgi:hypothetical protein
MGVFGRMRDERTSVGKALGDDVVRASKHPTIRLMLLRLTVQDR